MTETTARFHTSVRGRLTLWYTSVLALFLIGFGVFVYGGLSRVVSRTIDNSLEETAEAFVDTWTTALRIRYDAIATNVTRDTADEFRYKDRRIEVYDSDFHLIASSEPLGSVTDDVSPTPPALPRALLEKAPLNADVFATAPGIRSDPVYQNRVLLTRRVVRGVPYIVAVARPLRVQVHVLSEMRLFLFLGIPFALILAAGGGYFLAYKSLRPVVAMSEQAARISATNLNSRIGVANQRDELGKLAGVLNDLLERLERAFQQQRRLLADASHELRTPVAIVRGEAEVALARKREPDEYREALGIIHDEGRRMSQIVESLFTMARAEAGQYRLVFEEFFLDELVGECVRALRSISSARGIDIEWPGATEVPCHGDEALIRRLIVNLLDNALKYTPEGGRVTIQLERRGEMAMVTVTDTGQGIPAEAQPHIFEPFFRADAARSRRETAAGSGAGLGLAIAHWVADVHGGRLELTRSDSRGSTFTVFLPALPSEAPAAEEALPSAKLEEARS